MLMEPDLALAPPLLEDPMPPPVPPVLLVLMESLSGVILLI
jgi:hypothetical protein